MRIDEFKKNASMAFVGVGAQPVCPEDDKFVPFWQLSEHGIYFTRVHLRRLIESGLFPGPVMLSPNRVAWRLSDLAVWKKSRRPKPQTDHPA